MRPKELNTSAKRVEGLYQNAVILIPKQAFVDWVNILSDEEDLFTVNKMESSVYLLSNHRTEEEVGETLKLIYLKLFDIELEAWINEEDNVLLPRDKTYKVFLEWFEVKICMNVFQVVDDPQKQIVPM